MLNMNRTMNQQFDVPQLYIDKNKDELTEMQIDTDGKLLARYTTPDDIFQLGTVGYFG